MTTRSVAVVAPLPGIQVSWPQVVPVAPDTFVQYNVKRRDLGATTWTRIAVIAALGTTAYIDYTTASGAFYEYTVTWTSNRSGNLFESAEGPPAQGSVTFTGSFLHDATRQGVNALAYYLQLRGTMRQNEPRQSPTITPVWGRARPTVAFGTYRAKHYTYQLIPHLVDDRALWQSLELLQRRQQEQAVPLCLRTGDMGDRLFVILSKLTRADPPYEFTAALEFEELHFSEAT